MKKGKTSNSSGITLIALVISIIVLLILAGISIAMLSGNNSILQKATTAKENTERTEIVENAKIDVLSEITKNKGNELQESQLKDVLKKYFINSEIPEDLSNNFENLELTTLNNKYKIKVSEIYQGQVSYDIVNGTSSDWQLNDSKDTIVEYIGDGFEEDTVIIPNNVDGNVITKIGTGGMPIFARKSDLIEGKKLKISNGIQEINGNTFFNCSGFQGHLIIPSSVKSIAATAFGNCSGFNGSLIIPKGCNVKTYAFGGCAGLDGDLTLQDGVTLDESQVFQGTNFTGCLTIGMEKIKSGFVSSVFYQTETKFSKIIFTNNVKIIDIAAFANMTSLTDELIIPSNIIQINARAFAGCTNLTSIIIKNSTENITVADNAFEGTVTPTYN